jgi:hypothetical protein
MKHIDSIKDAWVDFFMRMKDKVNIEDLQQYFSRCILLDLK